jgi:cytochrome b561
VLGVLALALGGVLLKWRLGAPIGPFAPLPFAAPNRLPAHDTRAAPHRRLARVLLAAAALHALAALSHQAGIAAWGQIRQQRRVAGKNPL